ncbi:hypothetical protein BDW22DRAFT_1345853 [Trametopsis cervina]|nr:hypothetical protein BDW22DRAFT_1345853 [Trametopsis cervina]
MWNSGVFQISGDMRDQILGLQSCSLRDESLILNYIGTDERGDGTLSERRSRGLHDLQSCSLVCLYWSNHCRRYIFYYLISSIRSLETLQALRRLVASRGSKRLLPIDKLVVRPTARVWQNWETPSWIHHVPPLPLPRTTCHLTLSGPVPPRLPISAVRSPHWSAPRTLPPLFTPYSDVRIEDVAFPFFRDLIALLKHFKVASSFSFHNLTWKSVPGQDDFDAVLRPLKDTPNSCDGEYAWAYGIAAAGCTDNMLACLQACQLYPTFPLFRVAGSASTRRFVRALYDAAALATLGGQRVPECTMEWHNEDRDVNCTVFNDAGLIAIVKWAVGGGGSAEKSTISGVLLCLWHNAHVDLASFSSKLDVVASQDMVEQYNVLQLVILAFGDRETMDRFVLDHPERYCFAVRTEGAWSAAGEGEDDSAVAANDTKSEMENSGDELREDDDEFDDDVDEELPWKIIEPTSMRATGDSFVSLDEVMPGLFTAAAFQTLRKTR